MPSAGGTGQSPNFWYTSHTGIIRIPEISQSEINESIILRFSVWWVCQKIKRTRMQFSFYQLQPPREHHYFAASFVLFNYFTSGPSAPLGISPPPEWMGSWQHHCTVANNITKEAVKGRGKKPCHPHFLPHYLTNEFLFFQLHCCRVVHTIGDISAPRMNGKPATPSPCHQHHYKEGSKRARYETMPSTFSTPLSH